MSDYTVIPIDDLLAVDLSHLVEESKTDGFRFLERLVKDYQSGDNTFHQPGERLLGVYKGNVLVAIGGLNVDPFSEDVKVGRLRRFYVAKDHRRRRIGSLLIDAIIEGASDYFDVLVLHTDTEQAGTFYKAYGFSEDRRYPNATHSLILKK